MSCKYCRMQEVKGVRSYYCGNKESEFYEEECLEKDPKEPMVCPDKEERNRSEYTRFGRVIE